MKYKKSLIQNIYNEWCNCRLKYSLSIQCLNRQLTFSQHGSSWDLPQVSEVTVKKKMKCNNKISLQMDGIFFTVASKLSTVIMKEIWSLHSHPVLDCMFYSAFHVKQYSEGSKTSVLASDTCEEDCPLSLLRSCNTISHTYSSNTHSCVEKRVVLHTCI